MFAGSEGRDSEGDAGDHERDAVVCEDEGEDEEGEGEEDWVWEVAGIVRAWRLRQ